MKKWETAQVFSVVYRQDMYVHRHLGQTAHGATKHAQLSVCE